MVRTILNIEFVLVFVCTVGNCLKNDIYDLSAKFGYIAEPHDVITEDGYILTIFRIKNRSDTNADLSYKEPVLLQHGLAGSAEHFVVFNQSTAFFLYRENFDVWIGNIRGNFHAQRHMVMNRNSKEFWKFKADQAGHYDLPAMLDYILDITNRKKLSYIGHSQGSTMFFAMAAERPEYNEKVKIHIGLASAVYLKHTKFLISNIVRTFLPLIKAFIEYIGLYELPSVSNFPLMKLVLIPFCGKNPHLKEVCPQMLSLIEPVDHSHLNTDIMPSFIETQPAGLSIYQLLLFGQWMQTGVFGKYDWGPEDNLKFYNSLTAPLYNLSQVTVPVALMYATNDGLIPPRDISLLAKSLPNLVDYYAVPDNLFSHFDFIIGKNVTDVNIHILFLLNKYRS